MLTVNLKEWAAGQRKVRYLGYHFGGGQKDVMVLRRKPITHETVLIGYYAASSQTVRN